MLEISSAERRALRAQAHPLKPVVMIGQSGLTPAVLRELDLALKSHELIKARVFDDDRDARAELLSEIADKLNCAPVQHIGKLFVLWRPKPKEEPPRVTHGTKASHAIGFKKVAPKRHRAEEEEGGFAFEPERKPFRRAAKKTSGRRRETFGDEAPAAKTPYRKAKTPFRKTASKPASPGSKLIDHRGHLVGKPLSRRRAKLEG